MPFDASGNYTRVHDWTTDRDANIKIQALRMDQENDDIAGAFNLVMLRSGVAPMTGDLDVGQNSIVGLKNGVVGSPAIQFDNDTQTGLYLPSAGRLALTAGGVKRFEIDNAGAEVTGTLDVSGTTAITGALTVGGNTTITGTLNVTGVVTLTAPLASAEITGSLVVGGNTTTAGNTIAGGFFRSVVGPNFVTLQNDGTNSNLTATGQLLLYAGGANNMIFHTNAIERMRIAGSGAVTIAGAVTISGALSVAGALTLTTDLPVADGGTGASDAAGARTNLQAAAKVQNAEAICGIFSLVANKDYRIVLNAPHGGTITETTTKSASGSCTATFKINASPLGGLTNSVSSTEQSRAHISANTFVAGDDIVITLSANSSCQDMSFTIKYTRDLA